MKQNTNAKYFVGIITNEAALIDEVVAYLLRQFGECDYHGPWHPFDKTCYYEDELGANLKKCFLSFKRLRGAELLHETKLWCTDIEETFKENGKRKVNIDPGYIDYCKVVLASNKHGVHKIALTHNCWADFIMMHNKGAWQPLPWCFPDFASGIYKNDLTEIRTLFKKQLS